MDLIPLLELMRDQKASDLFITVGLPPAIKVDGRIKPVSNEVIEAEAAMEVVTGMMSPAQREEFEATHECNFAIGEKDVGRFRASAFIQRGKAGVVLRRIETYIPSIEELKLPPILKNLAMTKRGLIVFIGATGTGKSTSLASMIGYRNNHGSGHIITIEDPIEFVHPHDQCIITQREVGIDTESYETALKNTLRQAPDVILIGEIRDREAMDHAIAFAETGHLCLSTLHANSTNQALDRIINFFPDERRMQLLMDLSLNLKGMISQRLIPKIDGAGRMPAIEVMLNTPLMADMIFKGEVHEMKSLIAKSNEAGMQTFDQALFDLYETEQITFEDALRNADSVNDIRLRIKLESDTARKTGVVEDHREFELEEANDDEQAGGMI